MKKVWERRSHAFPPRYTPASQPLCCETVTGVPGNFQN